MPHAYLIIAHNEFEVLRTLLRALDDVLNDIYIHFDKKVIDLPAVSCQKSRLFILDNRVDVRWGDVSQIKTELVLFQEALRNGPYEYYHLISGTHLPLKSQDEIHSFFDSHIGQEVVRKWNVSDYEVDQKIRHYNFLIQWYQCGNAFLRYVSQHLFTVVQKLQRMFSIRKYVSEEFIKTDNWLSLTEKAVRYIVDNKLSILRKYRYSFCGDEFFVASELNKAGFNLFDYKNLLYVEFDGANPKTLCLNNLSELASTEYLFARKFSAKMKSVK